MQDDHAYLVRWRIQSSLFKHFQGYVGIFRGIDAYSLTLKGGQLGGRGDLFPAVLKTEKTKALIVFFGLNFPFKIHYSTVPLFLVFLTKCLSKCLSFLQPDTYLKPCETLTRHIQNPAIGHYLAIFRHIQNLVQHLHTQKCGILGILE